MGVRSVPAALRSRRTLTAAAFAVLSLLLALWLFESVVATKMFETRQQHLTSDLGKRVPMVSYGGALGVLQSEAIGLDVLVAEGTSAGVLRSGPGHVSGSPAPGEGGNIVVVGHRSRYGGPFGRIGDLADGDRLVLQARGAIAASYVVSAVRRTDAAGAEEAANDASAGERLVLVTSNGGRWSSGRTVVIATREGPSPVPNGASPAVAAAVRLPSAQAGRGLLLALLWAVVIGYLALVAWRWRANRYGPLVLAITLGFPLLFAALQLVLALDRVMVPTA